MNIRTKFRQKALEFLIKNGIFATRTTKPELLNEFFNKINPCIPESDLIRVGGRSDGGYLLPDDLEGIEACFSPGVSQVANFELELAARGIPCFLADYSVSAPPVMHQLFDFEKKYLGAKNDDVFLTLEDWVKLKSPNGSEYILQMDIEGAEYAVILHTPDELLKKFRIIVMEFHDLEALFDRNGFELISLTFGKLLKYFEIVHMHPNNCRPAIGCGEYSTPQVMEITFLRRDRMLSKRQNTQFPHPLDVISFPEFPDVSLPKCWRA